jgi:hypothetical protein
VVSTLDSDSTLAEIQAAYDDNSSYEEDGSTTKAKAFITACRMLIRRLPVRSVHGGGGGRGQEIETTVEQLQKELQAAQEWLKVNDSSATAAAAESAIFRSLEEFRD